MRTLILDGLFIYKNPEKFFEGKSSLEIIFEKSKINGFERFILIQNGNIKNIPDGIKNIIIEEPTPFNIIQTIVDEAKSSDDIMVFDAGNPFYDDKFISSMFERHEKYISDYTYGIGYTEGLIPTIVRKDIAKEMIRLVENDNVVKKDYLYYTLSKDINAFDIETFLSDFDLRVYRIKLGLNDEGDEITTKNLFEKFGLNISVENICKYYSENPKSNFTIPYMINLELSNFSEAKSTYFPEYYKGNKIDLSFDLAVKIIDSSKKLNHDIHIILGGLGEPLENPDFLKILAYISENNLNCIVESTGIKIDGEFISDMEDFNKEKIIFVLKYDCYDEDTYNLIHPNGNFSKVKNAYNLLKESGFKVYKQVVRMNENEVEIEKYIKTKTADDLLIKKYSTYCQSIPDKKVIDLSPLERIPCFHLRREINVKSNGKATICMYNINEEIGDFNTEEISAILERLKIAYEENAECNYKDFCVDCDDYYLFNF